MATRHANDHYPTPTALTLALLKELPQIGGAVIEPCAAEGKIAVVLRAHPGVTGVTTNDIDATMPTRYHGDATVAQAFGQRRPTGLSRIRPSTRPTSSCVWRGGRLARVWPCCYG